MNNYGNFVKPPFPIIAFFPLFSLYTALYSNSSAATETGAKPAGGVVINEILPSPDGPDGEEEWIELFNQNDFKVELTGWRLADEKGRVKNYVFPDKAVVLPKSFLVVSRQETKIVLNNDGDGLTLTKPDGEISDGVNYKKARQGKSYGRKELEWIWSDVPTPGAANSFSEEPTKLERWADRTGGSPGDVELAAINEPIIGQNNFLPSFIALTAAFSSSAIILFLKRKLKAEPQARQR